MSRRAVLLLASAAFAGVACLAAAEPAADRFPLDPQLKALADDVRNEHYRKLVLEKMLSTDLAAEWQRVATADNADAFLEKHGGKDKVLADPELKAAYERRVRVRDDFLDLMRQGYARHKQTPPFDKGQKAEPAGTTVRDPKAPSVAVSVVLPCPGAEKHWPRFRGPTGQGETAARDLPTEWGKDGKNVLWRVRFPGKGHSSPIAWGDRLFVTSASDDGKERYLHCVDAAAGKLLWSKKAPERPAEGGLYPKNGYASSTPVTDGERVIAFFGAAGLVCFDFDGEVQWRHDLTIKTTHGCGSSPVLYKNLVILTQDQNQADSLFFALDKRTGELVWQGTRAKAMSWNTPVIIHAGDRDELVCVGAGAVRGYDPATGKELWSLKGPTVEVVPAVVAGPDLLYSASGRNGPTLAFRPGGTGDVTDTHLAWRAVRGGPHVPSPGLANGRLYTCNDTGMASCLDAKTGKLLFQERLNDKFSASPVVAGDLLYFCGESGVTHVLRASDKLEVVAKNDIGAPLLASPAVVGNRLILRTPDELVCVGRKDG